MKADFCFRFSAEAHAESQTPADCCETVRFGETMSRQSGEVELGLGGTEARVLTLHTAAETIRIRFAKVTPLFS